MYKLAGIIAEYDPFHNGHAWQLQQAKALGAQRVAVAMSCGLTQRGALPLLPESVRVQAALTCGADLVFALPAPYACSGAECFARAGVQLLAAAGCDALVVGAETPDAAPLMEAARVLSGAEYRTALKARLAAGARSFAAARQAAVQAVGADPAMAALLSQPNNNLAVEYCRAILEQRAGMPPVPLPRRRATHGQTRDESGHALFASACARRALWAEGGAEAGAPFVPEKAVDFRKGKDQPPGYDYKKCISGYRCGITSKMPETGRPEVAFAGKSNVGKSSLINGLMNRKSLARTSAAPGKTQTINFYNINEELYLVDLPGYGYAKVSEQEKIKWGQLIERYLHGSKQLKVVFLLIDIRHKPSGNDKMMYEWIVSQGFNPVIIATKLDKIKRSQKDKQIKIVKEGLGVLPGTVVIPFSSVTKQGRDEIWELVESQFLNV